MYRAFIFIISLAFITASSTAQDDSSTIVQFETKSIDLGQIIKGEKVESAYTFTNISDSDVTIDLVSTCECTEAKWPSSPIAPGETATISFVFDSAQKDKEEVIQVDVYFLDVNPLTDAPYSAYLEYLYQFK